MRWIYSLWRRIAGAATPSQHASDLPPAEDLRIAMQAISDGDLRHAASHVGCVLFRSPEHSAASHLLDRIVQKAQKPQSLVSLKGRNPFGGDVAARAGILARVGQYNEALSLLVSLHQQFKDRGFWRLGLHWLADPRAATAVAPEHGVALLAAVMQRNIGDVAESPRAVDEVELALPAAASLAKAHPSHSLILAFQSIMLRKARSFDRAVECAQTAHRLQPSVITGTALALAHKMKGNTDQAIQAYEDIGRLIPKDALDYELKCTELLAEAGRYQDGLDRLERIASDLHGTDYAPGANALKLFLRYQVSHDESLLPQVMDMARQHPHGMVARIVGLGLPYVDFIPAPSEATLNLARELTEKHPGQRLELKQVAVTSLEAPSCRYAIELALGMGRNSLKLQVCEVQHPDPRQPISDVPYTLWTYTGTDAAPALPVPPADLQTVVAGLARTPFQIGQWYDVAGLIAAGLQAEQIPLLLAVMLHPPEPPHKVKPWDWIQAIQIAAGIVIARMDDAWAGSARRAALVSMVHGPMDWATTAGIVAMTQVVLREANPEAVHEVPQLFLALKDQWPQQGYCPYREPLLLHMRKLPDGALTPEQRQRCEAELAELQA